jgi:hypothetical protein
MKSQPLGFLNGLDLGVASLWLALKELASLTMSSGVISFAGKTCEVCF